MNLKAALSTFKAQFREKCSHRRCAILEQSIAELAARLLSQPLLRPGDRAPDFALPGTDGKTVRLSEQLAHGPVLLSFYRGGWCPYCALELRAYQCTMPRIQALGATLIALSPQTLERARNDVEQHLLGYLVARDPGNRTAHAFGIDYPLTEQLKQMFIEIGHPLPEYNGDESWRLPVPATFVIAADGRIALAHIDADYRNRLEPAEAVATLGKLTAA